MGSGQFQGLDVGRKDCWMFFPEDLTLITDKAHPLYDPRVELPVKGELVEDIMLHGVLETCLVRKDGSDIIVIDGRQRVKSAIEANKRLGKANRVRVPCIVQRGEDVDLFAASCSTNEHRQDDDPMRKAEKAARLIDHGKTEAEVAVVFGVKLATIKQWMKMLELAAPVRNAVKAGKIAPSAAARLSSLSSDEQKKALEEALEMDADPKPKSKARKMSTKGAAALARSMKAKAGSKPRSIRRKEEVEKLMPIYEGTVYEPFVKWFLGEDVQLPEV